MEKFAENCKISQNLEYQDKFWTKYMFNRVKKSCLVLKLCHFKFQYLDVPMKIVW